MQRKISGKEKSILILDDDAELLNILREVLKDIANVEVSRNWLDARSLFERQRYDLIIMDVYLPDVKPMEPLEYIHDKDPDYPVILMSGHVDRNDPLIERAMYMGVNTIIPKPFDFEEIRSRVMNTLNI